MKNLYKIMLLLVILPGFAAAQNNSGEFTKPYTDTSWASFFIGTALNITHTSPNKLGQYYQNGGRAYTSYSPAVSVGLDVYANPNVGKLLLRLEAMVSSASYKSQYQNNIAPYVPVKASYNEIWYSFAPQIIYNFYNESDFKVYAGLGVLITYHQYLKSYYGTSDSDPSNPFPGRAYGFSNFVTPFILKAGVQFYKRLAVYVNYLTPVPTTSQSYFQLNKSGEQVGLSYFFK